MFPGGKIKPVSDLSMVVIHSTWTVREAALAARAASSRFALTGRMAE